MDDSLDNNRVLRLAVLVEGGLGVLAVALAWAVGIDLRGQLEGTWPEVAWSVGRGVAATLPMLAVFWYLVCSRHSAMRQLRRQVDWLIDVAFREAGIAQIALVALLAGVGEELLFRGVLQPLFGQWTSPLVGLAICSLLFGLLHCISLTYFLWATVVGVYLGWLAWWFDELWAPITAHGLYDFVAIVYLVSRRGPTEKDDERAVVGAEASQEHRQQDAE